MYNFKVEDMTCGHCAATVEKAVKDVDANAEVKIDVTNRLVEVRSDKPAATIVAAISEAGYTGELRP